MMFPIFLHTFLKQNIELEKSPKIRKMKGDNLFHYWIILI